MKRLSNTRIVLIVAGAIFIIGIILAIPYLKALWNKPLGATLDLPTLTSTVETIQPTQISGEATLKPTCTFTPTSAPM